MSNFEWPWEYNFPPFFTIQTNSKTRAIQLTTWCDLVLKYQRHQRQTIINVNDDSELFANEKINRKLSAEGKQLILNELQKSSNALPLDKAQQQWEVYWHPLDEWGNIIYKWAQSNGLTNTVCTFFEILNGDMSVNEEFYGLDQNVLIKALKTLQAKQKCELFDGDEGVKFY